MNPTLEYVRRRDRTWRDVRALAAQITRRAVVVLVLTFIAGIAALMMWRGGRHVEPGNAARYWDVLYNGWGSEVRREGGSIVFVWWGRDHHMFMRVDERDTRMDADAAAQKYVWTLIDFMRKADGEGEKMKYSADLRELTGQDFKSDGAAWHAWAATHVADIKGGDEVFARLQWKRSAAAQAQRAQAEAGLPADAARYDPRDPLAVQARWEQIYRQEMEGSWWTGEHAVEVAVLVGYGVAMCWLIRRFVRTPVARDWRPGLRT